jgi:hypothetical protein
VNRLKVSPVVFTELGGSAVSIVRTDTRSAKVWLFGHKIRRQRGQVPHTLRHQLVQGYDGKKVCNSLNVDGT